jgi:hypothetical protein
MNVQRCSFIPGELIEVVPKRRRYGVELVGYPLELNEEGQYWENIILTPPDASPMLFIESIIKNNAEKLVVLYEDRLYLGDYLDHRESYIDLHALDTDKRQWRKYEHA